MITDIEKKEREFLRDLDRNFGIVEVPFVKNFKNNTDLKNSLFADYLKTELKPNFVLFSEKHLTADELSKRNNKTKENELWSRFNELKANKQLPKEFYTHHISDTTIYKKLSSVKLKMNDFYNTTSTNNPNEYAISFSIKVINILDSLSLPKLKKEILNDFVNNEENVNLTIEFSILNNPNNISKDKALKDFRDLKMFADNYIVEHLKSITSTNESKNLYDFDKIVNDYNEYEKSITISEIADKETAERLRIFEGEKFYSKPIPETKELAFERFNKYDSILFLIQLIRDFNKYPISLKRLTDELDTINEWIKDAETIKFDEAINIYNKNFNASKDMQNEYIKLLYGYYETKEFKGYLSFFGNNSKYINAKYFLFKDWLENEIKKIENNEIKIDRNLNSETQGFLTNNETQQIKKNKPKKTLFEFIHNIEDKEVFMIKLKNTFPTEMGKDIRVIVDILKEESILIIGAREYKHFLKVLKEYFNRHIGEYQGIQNKMTITKETSEPIKSKLNPLIIEYKTT